MKIALRIGAFIIGVALTVGLFWLGGENFDHRSPGVALIALSSIIVGCQAAAFQLLWGVT